MLRILRGELRDSWPAWAGVSLALITTGLVVSSCLLVIASGTRALADGDLPLSDSAPYTAVPGLTLAMTVIVAITVVSMSVSMVVDSRRGALARLALAGATPGQVAGNVLGQLVVVAAVCCLIADVLAIVSLQSVLRFISLEGNTGIDGLFEPRGVIAPLWLLGANLFTIGFCAVVSLRQVRRAALIPPVEALRESARDPEQKMGLLRWATPGGCLLLVLCAFAAIAPLTAHRDSETVSSLMQLALLTMVLMLALFAALSPALLGPLARAWTALIPLRDPVWQTARRNIYVPGARFSRSVVPIMVTIGLILSMLSLGPIIYETSLASDLPGGPVQLESADLGAFLTLLGPVLLVSIAGGVGSLFMMSRQRDAELALLGVAGATPGQRLLIPLVEAVILVVTAAVPGTAALAVMLLYFQIGLTSAGLVAVLVVPGIAWGAALGGTLVIMIAATVLPTLAAARVPERRVIARLVAE